MNIGFFDAKDFEDNKVPLVDSLERIAKFIIEEDLFPIIIWEGKRILGTHYTFDETEGLMDAGMRYIHSFLNAMGFSQIGLEGYNFFEIIEILLFNDFFTDEAEIFYVVSERVDKIHFYSQKDMLLFNKNGLVPLPVTPLAREPIGIDSQLRFQIFNQIFSVYYNKMELKIFLGEFEKCQVGELFDLYLSFFPRFVEFRRKHRDCFFSQCSICGNATKRKSPLIGIVNRNNTMEFTENVLILRETPLRMAQVKVQLGEKGKQCIIVNPFLCVIPSVSEQVIFSNCAFRTMADIADLNPIRIFYLDENDISGLPFIKKNGNIYDSPFGEVYRFEVLLKD